MSKSPVNRLGESEFANSSLLPWVERLPERGIGDMPADVHAAGRLARARTCLDKRSTQDHRFLMRYPLPAPQRAGRLGIPWAKAVASLPHSKVPSAQAVQGSHPCSPTGGQPGTMKMAAVATVGPRRCLGLGRCAASPLRSVGRPFSERTHDSQTESAAQNRPAQGSPLAAFALEHNGAIRSQRGRHSHAVDLHFLEKLCLFGG